MNWRRVVRAGHRGQRSYGNRPDRAEQLAQQAGYLHALEAPLHDISAELIQAYHQSGGRTLTAVG